MVQKPFNILQLIDNIPYFQLCIAIKDIVERDLNSKLRQMGTKVPLSATSSLLSSPSHQSPMNFQSSLNQLFFDYSQTADPTVTAQFIDFFIRGEVSYMGRGGTPFEPAPLPDDNQSGGRMLMIWVADFVLNSFIYHGAKNGILVSK